MDAIAALAQLRADIDSIDRSILRLLAQRFEKTAQVGIWKARSGESATNAERQRQRTHLLRTGARSLGLPEQMVFDLYARISREVVAGHIARGAPAGTSSSH